MKSSTKKLLVVGGVVAAAGVAFWYFFLGPGAPASGTASTTPPWNLPQNAAETAVISEWASGASNAAQWMQYMQTMGTQEDIDTMATLISQYWNANVAPPYALDNYFTMLSNQVAKV